MNSELENAKQITLDYGGVAGEETSNCKKWLSCDVKIIIRKIVDCNK
jgi:hypothetical protein